MRVLMRFLVSGLKSITMRLVVLPSFSRVKRSRQGESPGGNRAANGAPRRQRGWRRRAAISLGNLLIGLGVALFLTVGVLYAYGAYERYRFEQALPTTVAELSQAEEPPMLTPTAEPSATATAERTVVGAAAAAFSTPSATATPEASPTPSSTATPTPTPPPRPPKHVVIPRIEVDTTVVPAKIENGEWKVPKFVAGHLEGTANPGAGSNVVLSGHVESISSGNVFARLRELRPGDVITLSTSEREFAYVVTESRVVKNNDLSVVAPTSEETLSLITCTGTWLPLQRDYDRRLVVIAKPAPPRRWVPVRPGPKGP